MLVNTSKRQVKLRTKNKSLELKKYKALRNHSENTCLKYNYEAKGVLCLLVKSFSSN